MKVKVEMEVAPFTVPTQLSVIPKNPVPRGSEQAYVNLEDLDAETLWQLCEDFKKKVFEVAKKNPPPRTPTSQFDPPK